MHILGFIVAVAGFFCLIIGKAIESDETEQDYYRRKYTRPPRYRTRRPGSKTHTAPHRDLKIQTTPPDEEGWKEAMSGKPGDFARAQLGQTITYQHPQLGTLQMEVLGTVKYVELWQKRKSSSEPWVPTGNLYTAHRVGEGTLLYEWKGQLCLLDQYDALSDSDIKRNFLEPARKFGRSDETADVYFAYPPGSWKVTDIGKFRVKEAQGRGLRLDKGALGRFLHAEGGTGLENRMIVVEDYQEGGGGEDTLWRGWKITWNDILEIK